MLIMATNQNKLRCWIHNSLLQCIQYVPHTFIEPPVAFRETDIDIESGDPGKSGV